MNLLDGGNTGSTRLSKSERYEVDPMIKASSQKKFSTNVVLH